VPALLAPVDYTAGWHPSEVKAGDFNGDHILDLVTLNGTSDVTVLLGNPDGTFQPARYSEAGQGYPPVSLAVGDFNEDGKLDLATGNNRYDPYHYGVNDVVVLIGNGDGTFASPVYLGTNLAARSVATGDLNGDDNLDLVVTTRDDVEQPFVSVLLGRGDGTFAPPTTSGPYLDYLTSPALADFNGDGNADVVSGRHVLLSNGDGTFRESSDVGFDAYFWTAADLDGDGNLDLAGTTFDSETGGIDVSILLGRGDGTFRPPQFFGAVGAGWNLQALSAADVSGDGVLDLVTIVSGGPDGNVTALLGSGDGSFGRPIAIALDHDPSALVVADVNADGLPDVAVTSSYSSMPGSVTGTLSVLLNDGVWPPDDPPLVRISDTAITESNSAFLNVALTVTLSHSANVDVTIHYATADITATSGSDYTAASGDIVIPAGQTSARITVPIKDDRLGELTETFAVNLSAATNAKIDDGQGIVTIFDNEPRISLNDVSMSEGKKGRTTLFTFAVTLSAAYDQPVTVSFRTVNGTATTGDGDYVARSGTLTFAPGERTKTITIEVKGDNKRESDEYFYLDLFGNSNSWITRSRGIGTILNDD
jgi:hypothetical protein